jgi:HK97 family phage portal protein
VRFLGLNISRAKAATTVTTVKPKKTDGRWLTIFDWRPGAFQQNDEFTAEDNANPDPLLHSAVFRCLALISGDIAKLPFRTLKLDGAIWKPLDNSAYSPLLRAPNDFQTFAEFLRCWVLSLLLDGNAYILKGRNRANIVRRLTVLDPGRVTPMVDTNGRVFYQIDNSDYIVQTGTDDETIIVPASEIIHDKYLPLEHPLIGAPPLEVARLAANAGRRVLGAQDNLFKDRAVPPGIISVPSGLTDEQITAISDRWQEMRQTGKAAVVEEGMKFEPLAIKSVDTDALTLLSFTSRDVCVAFGVPAWKVGVEPMPAVASNAEVSELHYYKTTLQVLIKNIEDLLDVGLALGSDVGIDADLNELYRMDTKTRYEAIGAAIKAAWLTPNEGRAREMLEPLPGGDALYMQQQNYSLEALAKRDTSADPFGTEAKQKAAADAAAANNQDSSQQQDGTDGGVDATDSASGASDNATSDAARALGTLYRGVYSSDEEYLCGQFVTHKGALWHCDEPHLSGFTPGTSAGAGYWTLAVKRGRA